MPELNDFLEVPEHLKKFIYIEFNKGMPSDRIIEAYQNRANLRAWVEKLYKDKQARKIKLQEMRSEHEQPIEEMSSSKEDSKNISKSNEEIADSVKSVTSMRKKSR